MLNLPDFLPPRFSPWLHLYSSTLVGPGLRLPPFPPSHHSRPSCPSSFPRGPLSVNLNQLAVDLDMPGDPYTLVPFRFSLLPLPCLPTLPPFPRDPLSDDLNQLAVDLLDTPSARDQLRRQEFQAQVRGVATGVFDFCVCVLSFTFLGLWEFGRLWWRPTASAGACAHRHGHTRTHIHTHMRTHLYTAHACPVHGSS